MADSIWRPIATTQLSICDVSVPDEICSTAIYTSQTGQRLILVSFSSHGIYSYDIDNAAWSHLSDWDFCLCINDLSGHGSAVCGDMLHLFGGYDPMHCILDLNSDDPFNPAILEYNCEEPEAAQYFLNVKEAKGVFIGSNLHIIGYWDSSLRHIILDTVQNQTTQNKVLFKYNIKGFQFIHAEKLHRLMIIGGQIQDENKDIFWNVTQHIWYCETADFEWKLYAIKVPTTRSWFSGFLFCDTIIVLVYPNLEQVWCLDLLEEKWYKSETLFILDGIRRSQLDGNTKCIKIDERTVHFLKQDIEGDMLDDVYIEMENHSFHLAVNTMDIVSNELMRKYKRRHIMLFCGFVAKIRIPSDVLFVMGQFYSVI